MPSMSFFINDQSTSTAGAPIVKVTVTENSDGTLTFFIEQLVAAGNYLGDLRGFFFDLANESIRSSLVVTTSTRFLANGTSPLLSSVSTTSHFSVGDDSINYAGSSSNNMNGLLGSDGGYDAAIEIGSEGVGTGGDDVRAFSFTLDSTSRDLTLADLANVNFGVRIMSVGRDTNGDGIIDTARDGSSKLLENSGVVAVADVDSVKEDGSTVADGNVLTGSGGSDANTTDGKADLGAIGATVIGVASGAASAAQSIASGTVGRPVAGTYGSITIANNGAYTYALNNDAVQFLGAGESATETFTYTIKTADGDTSTTTIVVTINGTNDGPDIKLSAGDTAAANLTETNAGLNASGKLTILDVDTSDTVNVVVSSVATSGTGGTNGISADALKAMLSLTGNTGNAADGTAGSLGWSFNSSGQAFDYLGAGETLVLTYTLTGTDSHGASDTQLVTVTINGTNDVAVISGTTSGAVTEDASTPNLTTAGTLTISDVDQGQANFVPQTSVAGTYGTFTLAANGEWTYTADNSQAAIQQLGSGQALHDSFTAASSDGSANQLVTVTITGINDAPVVTGAVTGTATEDGMVSTLNALANASDVDAGTTLSVVNVPSNLPAGVSYDAATHSFTLDPSNAAFQSLADGASTTVTVSYGVTDGTATTPATATWTITGTNDAPVVTAAVTGTATEDGVMSTLNALANASDVDAGTTLSVVNLPANLPAGVSYDAATHSFTLDPTNAAFQSLADGAITTVTVSYGVTDGTATTPASVAWTITGTNDAPVVTAAVTGTATEDGVVSTLDALANASDVDAGTTLSVVNVPANLPAGVSYDAATHSFTLDPSNAAFQSLADGASTTVTVSYGVTDGTATTPATATWTITGTNDAPVVTAAVTGTATEDGMVSTLDALANASDVDAGTTLSVVNVPANLPAGVSYDAATHSFTLDPTNAAFQSLADGASTTVTVSYGVTDGTATTPASVAWTITGTNDVAVISGTSSGAVSEDASTPNLTTSGTLTISDADQGQANFVPQTSVAGAYGTFTLAANGQWTYTADNSQAAIQQLGATQSLTDSFTAASSDGTAHQLVTVTINGTNDVVTVVAADTLASGAVVEDTTSIASGTIAFTDVDLQDGHTASVAPAPANTTSLGSLVLGAVSEAAGAAGGTVGWTYTINDAAAQYLAAGEIVTETYVVTLDDGHGSTTTQNVTVTITGTNDVAVIGGTSTGTVTEDALTPDLTTGGTLTISDVDQGQANFVSQTSVAGTYGTFTLAANGEWTYTADNSQAAIQQLGSGQSLTDSFTAASSDGSANQLVTVTITGTNDVPVAAAAVNAVDEDASISGQVSATDADAGQTAGLTYALVDAAHVPEGLTFNADGSYSFDASSYDSLAAGEHQEITVGFTASDATSTSAPQTLTITVTGTNDAPVVTGAVTGTATEDGMVSTLDALANASDVDAGTTLSVVNVPASLPAGVSYDAATHSLTLDPSNAAFQSLADGASTTVTVSYGVTDGTATTPASVAWTITGTNDVPVAVAAVNAVDEDASVSGHVSATDADAGQTAGLTYALVDAAHAPAGLTFNADGSYSFDASSYDSLAAGEHQLITVGFTASDATSTSAPQTLTITVTGTNDVPVAVAAVNAVNEDASISGQVSATDADAGQTAGLTYALVDAAHAPEGLTFNADGSYSFDASSYDSLVAGEQQVITVQFTASDAASTSAPQTLTITVTGTNDVPVAVAAVNAVNEDASISGQVSATDADAGQTAGLTYALVDAAHAPEGLTFNADGSYSFDASSYDSLAAGQQQLITVGFTASDATSTSAPQTLTITLTGTNDVPVVSGAVAGTATEDGVMSTLNALANASDVDAGTTLSVVNVPANLPAGVSYDAATHSFTLDPTNAAFQSLAAGANTTVTVSYGVTDGTATTPASVAWTITGTNDAPVVTAAVTGTATEDGVVSTLNALANASDVDAGTTLSVVNVPSSLPAGVSYDAATHSFTLDPTNAAFQSLADGASTSVSVSYGVSDGTATTPATATWTITGTNDVPVAVAAVNAVDEDASVSGHVSATDADAGQTAGLTYALVDAAHAPAGLTFNADGSYSFDASSYDSLAAGEHQVITVQFTASDETSTSAPQTLTITVTGTNDAPVVTAAVTGTATEDGAVSTLDALANASDVDAGTTLSVVNVPASLPAGVSYDAATHSLTLDPSNAAFQSLADGASTTVTVSYGVTDGTATTPATATWTITGTNDAPVVTAAVTGTATEDGMVSTLDALANASDVDAGTTLSVVNVPANLPAGVSYDAATHSFTLDPTNAAFQSLADGASTTVTVSYGVTDGTATTPASVAWTITGTNDVAVISGTSSGAVSEDASTPNLTTSGTLTISDADQGQANFVAQTSVAGTYGTFTLAANGQWTYTADNNQAAIQQLGANQSLTDSFTAASSDGSAHQVVTVTINGTNDVATITVDASVTNDRSVTEAGGVSNGTAGDPSASGKLLVNDVDSGQAGFQSPSSLAGTYGAFTFNATSGAWTYTLNNASTATQALTAGQVVHDTLTVQSTDGTANHNIDVTVTGANDAATITVDASVTNDRSVTEAGGVSNGTAGDPSASGKLLVNDVDSGQAGFQSPSSLAGTYGTFTFNATSGAWTYTLNNASTATQALTAGQVVHDTLTVQSTDGTANHNIDVTVTGANDAATITVDASVTNDRSVTEAGGVSNGTAGDPSASGKLLVSDVDNGQAGFLAPSSLAGTYGTFTFNATSGAWTYTLNNASTATQALTAGQVVHDTLTVQSTDGTANHNIDVTVTGANDAPVVSNTTWTWGTGNNSKFLTVAGSITDPDAGANSETVTIDWGDQTTTTFAANGTGAFPNQVHKYSNSGNFTVTLTVTDASGAVVTKSTITSNNGTGPFPAGVAGEPINLALEQPAGASTVKVTIPDLPTGWQIEGAEQQPDGTWVVQTSDVSKLAVSTPADFAGAAILDLTMAWTDSEGVEHSVKISDNVEAYAPGNPIFAWSGDDTLTGSASGDMFVFAQPIGHDVIHEFDVNADKIDLIGYSDLQSFDDVLARMTSSADGDALLTLASGQTVEFDGVAASSLTASNFVFNLTASVHNSGQILIGNGALLPMSGNIENSGTISVASEGSNSVFQVIQDGVTLTGHGQLVLSDNSANHITGSLPSVTFNNVDNVISGAGQIGGGSLTLLNGGTIDGNGANALVIDTGTNDVTNIGTIQATGSGGVAIVGSIANGGSLLVNGSIMTIGGDVTGIGHVMLSGVSSIEFGGQQSNELTLDAHAQGLITFDHALDFSGVITGFDGNDTIDLRAIAFGEHTALSYAVNETGTGGVLTITDGVHTASLTLKGDYHLDDFIAGSDGHGGLLLGISSWLG